MKRKKSSLFRLIALIFSALIDTGCQSRKVYSDRSKRKNRQLMPSFTFPQFLKRYPNDDACLDEMFDRAYKDLQTCPTCEKQTKWHRVKKRKCYACQHCGHHLYPLAKTPFKSSKLPLTHWFFAILLFSNSKNGVSAKELQRQLGVSYPTAWRMGHVIRDMMDESGEIVLHSDVEIDETLVGGRKRGGKRGWGSENKTCVFGMVSRGSKIRTQVVPDRKAKTLFPIIVNHTEEDVTAYTDDFRGYSKLGREVADHKTVNHSAKVYVDPDDRNNHTNTIEGHWSIVKRSIRGTHTAVSRKHLQRYLNEFDFRRNHRTECLFDAILNRSVSEHSPGKEKGG